MIQQSTFFSVSLALGIVSLAFAYYVGAMLGLSIPYIGSNITLFWPPAGIALAVLTLWGLALCPGILLGSLVITLTIGELALPTALGVSLGNTLGPLAGAYILRKIAGFPTHFSNKQNIIRFLIISAGTSALTASFGTLILYLNDKILIEQLQLAWLGWWSGDMIGILVFAPPFFFWSTQSIKNFLLNLTTRWEFILAISSCIGLSWIVFIGFTPLNAITSAIPYIVYLPLLWIGLRFNSMAVTIAVIVISSLATIGTSQGLGPFSEGNFYTDQFLLCVFITTTSLISFMMISIQSSRKQVEQNLRDSESRLRLALEAANQGLYDLNIQTDQAIVSPEYVRMLGHDPNSFQETTEKWLERMHPEDRERTYQIYKDYINGVKSNYEVEFRQLTQTGEWKWILSLGKIVEWDDQGHPLRMLGTHTDISDFKAKELVLQQNEEALHRTQIIAKLGSWHFDLIQDVLTLSKEAFRIFGAGRQAPFSFSSFLAHVLPEDRENVNLAWQSFLKGDPYDIEFRFKLNARTKWVRVRAEITTLDSNSVPIKAVGTIQDISERKQAIEEITQAKNLLRTVIDASPDMISVKDKQHRFLLVNQSLATSQGLEPTAMLGKPDTDFWPDYQCYGDSARNIRGFHVDDNEAFSGRTVHNPADQALLANGELRWFDTIKIPLRNMQGHITAILGCARDITDRLHIESKYRALIEQIPAVTYTIAIDPEIHTVYVSPQLETQLGFSVEEWLANPQLWLNQIHPEDRKQILSGLSVSLTTGSPYYSEYRIYKKDGSLTWVRDDAVWLKDAMGKPVLLQGVMLDITHQRQAEEKLNTALEELRNSERFQRELRTLAEREQSRLGALLSAMNIGILFEDTDRRIEYINPTFTRMWNINEQDHLLNKPIQTLVERSNEIFSKPAHASKYLLNLLNSDEITKLSELELNNGRILTQSSYPVNDAEHKLIGRLWIYEDITQERQTAQQLLYLAERDPLTGLHNRHRFQEELDNMIATSLRNQNQFALLYFDLDDFKYINDTFGHKAGDTVLTRTSGEISSIVRQTEIFSRLGGDEFAILSPLKSGDDISALPSRIVNAIASIPIHFRDTNIRLTTSVGVAIFPIHGETAEDLIAHADAAMYQAKNHGKNTWALYDPMRDSSEMMMNRLTWYNRIIQALEQNLFEIHFQGVYETTQSNLEHLEILVRMRDKNKPDQLIMPGQFIPVAEKNGQIVNIDRWVIKRSIELLHQNPNMPPVAINISGRTFDDPAIPNYISNLLNEYHVDPKRLIIELTETAAVSDVQDAQRFIEAVHQTGCRVCLDDFGSGFSTFGYLKYLGVEVLKIDGLFIRDLPNNRDNQIFVKAMVEVARGLGKITVAEFVEDAATLSMVKNLGVDLAQGYYLGRPEANFPRDHHKKAVNYL